MRSSKKSYNYIFRNSLVFFAGALIAMPGLEISGISASYLPCFLALIVTPRFLHRIPRVILFLFGSGCIAFIIEVLKPTSPNFMSSRYRSITNQINTKFASSIESENLILWMKFSTALIGGLVLLIVAYSRGAEKVIVSGFLFGSVVSVMVGFFTLKPGEGAFVQSIGLGRTNTTFGMLCSYSIALAFVRPISLKFRWAMISLFMGGSLISGSRGAALTSVISIFLTLVWRKDLSKILIAGWSLLLALLVIIEHGSQLLFNVRVRAFTPNTSILNSNLIRDQLRDQAFRDWSYDPIGGVGFSVLTQGHSTYLQTLAAGGLLLFTAYFLTDLLTLFSAVSAQRLGNHGYLLALIVCSIFNHLTQNQIDIPFLYFVVGITLLESRKALTSIRGV